MPHLNSIIFVYHNGMKINQSHVNRMDTICHAFFNFIQWGPKNRCISADIAENAIFCEYVTRKLIKTKRRLRCFSLKEKTQNRLRQNV